MKLALLNVLAMFFMFSCTSPDNSTETLTIITGQVSNFSEVAEHDMISLEFADPVSGRQEISTTLDSLGRFRLEPDVEYPREFMLKYSGHLNYFVYPGDSLHFEIDGKCWSKISKSKEEEYAYYTLSGSSESMGNDVAKFTALYLDYLAERAFINSEAKALDPMEFRAFIDKQTEKRMSVIEEFSTKREATEEFQDWARRKINLLAWESQIMYCWQKAPRESNERIAYIQAMPDGYFDFLDEWDREDRGYLKNNDFEYFISLYQMILDQLVPLDTQQYYKEIWQEDFAQAAAYAPRYYSEVENGYARDLLIANYYYRFLDSKYYEEIKDFMDTSLIVDDYARAMITEKFNYEKDLFENMAFAEGSKFREITEIEDFFDTMIKNYPDKVIYVDFWATWCSPCMNEMPYAKKMKEQFEGKDVVFVYLANRCEEGAWKATIAERKMEGEHYLLTEEQYERLASDFEIRGIPRYIMVDRQGKVVEQNAPRPSSGEELIELINVHL